MEQDDLIKIVLKIGEKKPDLRVSGLNSIHPMYEALIAFLRRNLSDPEIAKRFAKNEESLREVLLTDIVLEQLTPQNREQLKTLLTSGASLKEIVDRAALYLSEGKRIQNNQILRNVSAGASSDRYFMRSLRAANPKGVYVETAEIGKVEERSKKMKRNRLIALISASLGTVLFAGASYLCRDYVHINFQGANVSELERNTNDYFSQISDARARISELKIDDKKKEGYIQELERKANYADSETKKLITFYSQRQEEMNSFDRQLGELKGEK